VNKAARHTTRLTTDARAQLAAVLAAADATGLARADLVALLFAASIEELGVEMASGDDGVEEYALDEAVQDLDPSDWVSDSLERLESFFDAA
jgi:hypothetical protein